MKLHIAETSENGYKTLCGKRAATLEEAQNKGFMAMVRPDNPNSCKSCQEIISNIRYWKEYRKVSSMRVRV